MKQEQIDHLFVFSLLLFFKSIIELRQIKPSIISNHPDLYFFLFIYLFTFTFWTVSIVGCDAWRMSLFLSNKCLIVMVFEVWATNIFLNLKFQKIEYWQWFGCWEWCFFSKFTPNFIKCHTKQKKKIYTSSSLAHFSLIFISDSFFFSLIFSHMIRIVMNL